MTKIWRKNFEIKKNDLNLPYESFCGVPSYERKFLQVKNIPIREWVWIIENGDTPGSHIPIPQLRKGIAMSIDVILKKPGFVIKNHKESARLNKQYFDLGEKIRKLNLSRKTNKELLRWHKKLWDIQTSSHLNSLMTTWFIDSDGEDFSKHLLNLTSNIIKTRGLQLDPATVFSFLSTPKKESLGQKEEKESLEMIAWIQKRPTLKKWFLKTNDKDLEESFWSLPVSLRKKMYQHYYKWHWFPYTYIGPAYDLSFYLRAWKGLLEQKVKPSKEKSFIKQKQIEIQNKRLKYIEQLGLNKYEKILFDIAADIVWLKGYRKDCYYHGFFVMDLLLSEIGKRSGLTRMQTKFLLPQELPRALKGKDFSHLANERYKYSVIYMKGDKVTVMQGARAKKFLKKINFEKVKKVKTNKLQGTCACPGRARGTVKIVNTTEDMGKMKKGDVMVSINTYPALVPAMKKASAIVTQDGGITCHAAIVSRELQTPCVVGCKIATSVLKDGDRVEVDAEKGLVKKIK